ncbi:MAG: PAS domain S-box protein [Methanomassiliicoccus sp.]|nr:PAS domain S-box protein [Methanomassiliicoccus sp.]
MRILGDESGILLIGAILMAAIFITDIELPIGVVGSMLYFIPVILCLWSPKRRTLFIVAGVATILTIVAVPLKSPGDLFFVLLNRPLSIATLWIIVMLGGERWKTEKQLSELKMEAEDRVVEVERSRMDLEEERNLLQTVMNGAKRINLAFMDRDFNFVRVNETFARTCGYNADEMIGLNMFGLFPNDEVKAIFQRIWDAGMAAEGTNTVFIFPQRPGEITYWDWNLEPVRGHGGEIHGLIFSLVNTTERRKAEIDLEESEKKYRGLFESIHEAAIIGDLIYDENGRIIDVRILEANPMARDILGHIGSNDITGQMITSVLDPELVTRLGAILELLVAEGGPISTESRYSADRQIYKNWYHLLEPGRIFITATDVTDIRMAQKEAEQYAEKLKVSNDELQQFAYVASHDLQEPLRMVINYLSLLEIRYSDALDARGKEYISYAVEGGSRMRELIEDLLAFARVDSVITPFVPVDMNLVMDKTLATLRKQIAESGAAIYAAPLPTVIGDESQMLRVMQNLISNAIKFRGEAAPMIHVDSEDRPGKWLFSVRDNGIGIDPKGRDKLFKLFQRLHNRDEYPGTGIGLAITKKIIERHGGNIWFESSKGEGTTFFFTISK